jgi:hypothetical protein
MRRAPTKEGENAAACSHETPLTIWQNLSKLLAIAPQKRIRYTRDTKRRFASACSAPEHRATSRSQPLRRLDADIARLAAAFQLPGSTLHVA